MREVLITRGRGCVTLTGGGAVALLSGDVCIERRTIVEGGRYYVRHWWWEGYAGGFRGGGDYASLRTIL